MRVYVCGQKAFGEAVLKLCVERGDDIAGVSSPEYASDGVRLDRVRSLADRQRIPWLEAGQLCAENMPEGVDVLIAAHSHDFIGSKTRYKCNVGAIGYHPSLLPLHRGRDAIKWTLKMGDRIAGGSVYWLNNGLDRGDVAAQEWCFVRGDDTPESLWRRELFPIGVRLFKRVLGQLDRGKIVSVPQDEELATWEPSWDRPPIYKPDLPALPSGKELSSYEVQREPIKAG
jgi:methionyl-tRNA formyltransferase